MGYRIRYGQTAVKEVIAQTQLQKEKKLSLKWIAVVCVMIAITILGKTGCLDFLIPGDKEVTRQAFSSMVENVREGENVKTAITAFCMEILNNAEIPD